MTDFILRRLLHGLVVLILVTLFVFIVIHLLPGDPITIYLSLSDVQNISTEQMEHLKHEFGLDKPVPVQYFNWISGVARGDLGESILLGQKVSQLIAKRLPVTLHLGIIALIVSGILGIFFGVICALRRGTWLDNILTILANLGITAPPFWIGILLIYIFAYILQLLPLHGYVSPFDDFWLSAKHLILPVFCVCLYPTAVLTRQTRSSMLEVIRQEYVQFAWSKGLSERTVILRHALKNAFIPIITLLGVLVRYILGGLVVIEMVFNVPGIGGMMVDAVLSQDFQVIQSGVLVIGVTVLLTNLLVDISYGWFDPRIRYT